MASIATVSPSRRQLLAQQTKDPSQVNTPSAAYDAMWVDWELGDDLWQGRERMLEVGRRWLPKEPLEEEASYQVRLNRSYLYGAYKDTLERLAAKPFSQEVSIRNEENLPESLRNFAQDVDLQGTDLTAFSKKILLDAERYGHTMVFVDMPSVPDNLSENPLSILEEKEMGVRPYWIHVSPPNLIGWRSRFVHGKEILTQIRIKEMRTEPYGEFGERQVSVIKVVTAGAGEIPGSIREYRKDKEGSYVEVPGSSRVYTYPGIPLYWLPLNPTGKGILKSSPPMLTLAELNLEHWQKSSDHSNILRFVSIAMVLLSGMGGTTGNEGDDSEVTGGKSPMAWGVNQILQGELGADGKYIEHSGAGIDSLFKAIRNIEERMETLGLQPLMSRQNAVTATAQQKDDAKSSSTIQSWIRKLETFLLQLYKANATWLGSAAQAPFAESVDKKEQITFDVFSDFELKVASRDDGEILLATFAANGIDIETLVTEFKKRGILGEEVDAKDVLKKIIDFKDKLPTAPGAAAPVAGGNLESAENPDKTENEEESAEKAA